jgi:hypothetical protein
MSYAFFLRRDLLYCTLTACRQMLLAYLYAAGLPSSLHHHRTHYIIVIVVVHSLFMRNFYFSLLCV